jgi:acetylornithine deacetylase
MLHGCGACDVKGFLACLLTAASEATPGSLKRVVRIVLTADEEIGCLGAHRLVAEDRLRARSLVIGEPTSLHAARAGKGYCLGEVTIFGAEAHSAHPQQGRSAIYDAARFLQAIERLAEELAAHRNDFFDPPYTTLNVGTIRGGSAKNIVPGECGFLLEWRPIPGQEPDLVPLAIERIGRELQQSDPAFRFAFKILRQQLGFETPGDASLVRAMEELTGRAPIAIPFASEASVFASLAEEIVVFGAGDMRTAHSPRECVPIAELHEAVRCIKALMQKG